MLSLGACECCKLELQFSPLKNYMELLINIFFENLRILSFYCKEHCQPNFFFFGGGVPKLDLVKGKTHFLVSLLF